MKAIELLIYCVGYEARSAFIASRGRSSARIGLIFDSEHVLSFESNLAQAEARHDVLINTFDFDKSFSTLVTSEVQKLQQSHGAHASVRVTVDVSSMTRRLMANVLSELYSARQALAISVLYAPAVYLPPPLEGDSFIDFAPIQAFEGWTMFPERPLSVVLGLGYEVDQAIGAIEYLDPSGIWAFVPVGSDSRFLKDVKRANEALWPLVDTSYQLQYPTNDPYLLFSELRGLVTSLSRRSRVVIVPGGPKIFSALSFLAKLEIGEEVSVWRASTHEFSEPRDVMAAGEVVRFDYSRPRAPLHFANENPITA
jgi:hypothetical protein